MLQVILKENKLTPDPDDYAASVQNVQKKTVGDLVKQLTISGSILKETECNAVIDSLLKAIAENLKEGYGFSSDYFSFTPSVSGVFNSPDDRFDPNRHAVELNLRLGNPLKEALQKVEVEVVPYDTPVPIIREVFDRRSKTTNGFITPSYDLDIRGDLLKISEPENEEQGVFLVSTERNEEYKVSFLYQNTPKTLQVALPDTINPGTYRLEVRTTVYGAKEVRTGLSPFTLTVQEATPVPNGPL